MSLKYMTKKELVSNHMISSIILMKFVGTLVKLKFMTNQSERDYLDFKEIFYTLVFSIGTWW